MATLNGVNYSNTSGLLLKTNATTQMSISTGGVIEFNQSYTFPTSDGSANTVLLTNGSGALSFSTIPNASLDNSSLTVTAGSGLANGGSVSLGGSVTLNVGAGTGIVVNANDVALDYVGTNNFIDSATNLEGTGIATSDTIVYHDATDNNVKKGLISDLPFSNNSGTVTSVAISGTDGIDVDSGSPITTSGTITLGLSNVPNSSLANSSITIAGTAISLGGSISGDDILSDVSAGQVTNSQLANSSITINGNAISLGGSINVGDINGVTAGNGLTGGGTSGTVTLNVGAGTGIDVAADTISVDMSELTTSTSDGDGDFFVVVDTANAQKKLTKGNINISGFNNDAGFTTNTGTVTSVAISGSDGIDVDSGSPITTSGTIALGLSNVPNSSLSNSSITINGTAVSLGGTINVGDITAVTAGTGLTGGGTSGAVTVNVDYAGSDNYILAAGAGTGDILTSWHIPVSNASNNVLYYDVLALPFSNNQGTVTSVAISGSDGIDVDSGSPITSSGTITLGLSNVPNASLANSSVTVTAGNGLANGGSVSLGGSVTLNVGAGTGLVANANDVALDYAGTDNFIDSATNLEGTGIALTDTIIYHDATDNNVKKGLVSDLPYTNSSGSVTSVAISGSDGIDVDSGSPITGSGTIALGLSNVPNSSLSNSSVTVNGGDGLTGGGEVSLGSSVTLNIGAGTLIDVDASNVNVDLSELTTSTSNADGDFFVVVDSSNNQKKLTKANINNSGFNNDAGYITSAGNTNIYGSDGTLSAARTVTQNGNNLEFKTTGAANTKFRKTTQANRSLTRVMIEADDSYVNVLELDSSAPSTFLVSGYEAGGARVFSVDGQGNLMATSKAFDIPHPNPEKKEQGMRLKHGNLEGPEHGIYIRGRQLNDKEIELPEYWKDLVDPDSITVQLTSVGSHQNLYVKEIKDWVVYIQNGNLFSNKIDCYYFIQAERIDVDRIEVEYYQ